MGEACLQKPDDDDDVFKERQRQSQIVQNEWIKRRASTQETGVCVPSESLLTFYFNTLVLLFSLIIFLVFSHSLVRFREQNCFFLEKRSWLG